MRRTYIQPQTEWFRMTECEAVLAAISGGISNSGQDDDGGSAKQNDFDILWPDSDDYWDGDGEDEE